MINSNASLYNAVRAISEDLLNAGENEWSCALLDAMEISTVPGEVLGELRLQLEKLGRSDVSERLQLRGRIDEALRYLNAVLRPRIL